MKFIPGNPAHLELTRRNLETLPAKLEDPCSLRTLIKQEETGGTDTYISVTAVEDEAHYADRAPGEVNIGPRRARLR